MKGAPGNRLELEGAGGIQEMHIHLKPSEDSLEHERKPSGTHPGT